MKLWSFLFTSGVVISGVAACAMEQPAEEKQPEQQQPVVANVDETGGQVSPTGCGGAACYPGGGSSSSSGTIGPQQFYCSPTPAASCGSLKLVWKASLGTYQCEERHCVFGGPGDSYYVPYNPCGLWRTYSCTPYGWCYCA